MKTEINLESEKKLLEEEMNKIAIEIRETKERLPAHSTKPPIMTRLFELEDRFDELKKKYDHLEKVGWNQM